MLKGKIKDRSERTIWAEWKHGWQLQLRFVTKTEFQKLYDRAISREWDKGFEKAVFNDGKFSELIGREVIVGWRNLTPDALRKLVELDDYPAEDLPYSADDAAELVQKLAGLQEWVVKVCADWEIFDAARRAEETKNLSSSPAGR